MVPSYLDHLPAGMSTRPLVHYAQLNTYDHEFRKYDFGNAEDNNAAYGVPEPPLYDFTKITTPTAIWAGDKDDLADVEDVKRLVEVLPNVSHFEVVPYEGFTHLDFAIAIDADTLVYAPLLDMMNKSRP